MTIPTLTGVPWASGGHFPMATLPGVLDILLHLDKYLLPVVQEYGVWTYALLFAIIFMETGSIVTPFLPGDSLLFVAGAFASTGVLNPFVLVPLLTVAAIAGDQVNYWVGRWAGARILAWNNRFVKPEYIRSARQFFDRHGRKSVFLARFAPVLRYLVPFLAGAGSMNYRWFVLYNILGGACWVLLLVGSGYFFGTVPLVRDNLSLVLILIIVASFGAIGIGLLGVNREWLRARFRRRTE